MCLCFLKRWTSKSEDSLFTLAPRIRLLTLIIAFLANTTFFSSSDTSRDSIIISLSDELSIILIRVASLNLAVPECFSVLCLSTTLYTALRTFPISSFFFNWLPIISSRSRSCRCCSSSTSGCSIGISLKASSDDDITEEFLSTILRCFCTIGLEFGGVASISSFFTTAAEVVGEALSVSTTSTCLLSIGVTSVEEFDSECLSFTSYRGI
mmetsp:Transcript_14196/g.21240  ORF Transcript_14196/g.21240 Transcript_14196/m.21240 type:complete len:210 (-) Transcript_14196:3217-3846(-)